MKSRALKIGSVTIGGLEPAFILGPCVIESENFIRRMARKIAEICAAEKIRCVEADLSPVDVYGADEMFCTGTMGELAGVIQLDNRLIGDGQVGPITKRLSELYAQRTSSEGVQVVE